MNVAVVMTRLPLSSQLLCFAFCPIMFMFFSYSTVAVYCLVQAFLSIGLAQASSSRPQPHELGFGWMVAETTSMSWSMEATCHIWSILVVQSGRPVQTLMHSDVVAPKRGEAWFAC